MSACRPVLLLFAFAACPPAARLEAGAGEPTPDAGRNEVVAIDAGAPLFVLPPDAGPFTFEAPVDDGSCERLRTLKSRCARDLDCELVTVGCGEVAVGSADLSRALELSAACERLEHLCPATVRSTYEAAVCVKQRCTTLEFPNDVRREQLCLDRAIERAPRDKKPVVIDVTPAPPIAGRKVTATASSDSREVARCLERVLNQSLWARERLTLRYTPGEQLEKIQPMAAPMPPRPSTRPARPMTKSVMPSDASIND